MDVGAMREKIAMGLATRNTGELARLAESAVNEVAALQNALSQAQEANASLSAEMSGVKRDAQGYPG